eukprot:GHVU01157522.1.p2 GENE.GHVU01157522.1~~GHVU01157522.1.p2  ORF type:complete len:140 (-),score=4.10 GHVU01157522.1:729-1148(-)
MKCPGVCILVAQQNSSEAQPRKHALRTLDTLEGNNNRVDTTWRLELEVHNSSPVSVTAPLFVGNPFLDGSLNLDELPHGNWLSVFCLVNTNRQNLLHLLWLPPVARIPPLAPGLPHLLLLGNVKRHSNCCSRSLGRMVC